MLAPLDKAFHDAAATADKAAKTKTAAEDAAKTAQDRADRAMRAKDSSAESRDRLANTSEIIKELRPKLLTEVKVTDRPSSIWVRLESLLRGEWEAVSRSHESETDASRKEKLARRKEKLQYTLKELATHNAPMDAQSVNLDSLPKGGTNREVLDKIIAVLRHDQIQSIRQYGISELSQKIEKALQTAYDQRAGMVYIRPPSAYLRTSYAATSLQDDPGLRWRNMLEEQASRSLPIIPSLPPPGGRSRITAEIDKQFWQSINRVRVAGGGNTQYVIAKDDIGNWYVKAYSANPSNIVNSARNLAMFSMGSAAGADLLSRVNGIPTGGKAGQAATTLERLYQRHEREYVNQTTNALNKAIELTADSGLPQQIKTSWGELKIGTVDAPAEMKTELQGFLTAFGTKPLAEANKDLGQVLGKQATADKEKKPAALDAGNKIVGAMQTIRRLHNGLVSSVKLTKKYEENVAARKKAADAAAAADKEAREKELADANQLLNTAKEVEATAKSRATGIVRDALDGFLASRRETVHYFDNAILFIGDAIKP